jgi:hypothetical protein
MKKSNRNIVRREIVKGFPGVYKMFPDLSSQWHPKKDTVILGKQEPAHVILFISVLELGFQCCQIKRMSS